VHPNARRMRDIDMAVLSVCPGRSGIVSEQFNISSNFLHRRIAPSFKLLEIQSCEDIRPVSPPTGPRVHEAMNIAQFSVSKSLYLGNDAR